MFFFIFIIIVVHLFTAQHIISFYKDQGLENDTTWKELKETDFYKLKEESWLAEKWKGKVINVNMVVW